jgi:hypothetical protein
MDHVFCWSHELVLDVALEEFLSCRFGPLFVVQFQRGTSQEVMGRSRLQVLSFATPDRVVDANLADRVAYEPSDGGHSKLFRQTNFTKQVLLFLFLFF